MRGPWTSRRNIAPDRHPSHQVLQNTPKMRDLEFTSPSQRIPRIPRILAWKCSSDPPFHTRRGPGWRELKQTPSFEGVCLTTVILAPGARGTGGPSRRQWLTPILLAPRAWLAPRASSKQFDLTRLRASDPWPRRGSGRPCGLLWRVRSSGGPLQDSRSTALADVMLYLVISSNTA